MVIFHSAEMLCLWGKLSIGLYLDLLIKAAKAQVEICAATTSSPVIKPRVEADGSEGGERWEMWFSERHVFSCHIRAMFSDVCV